MEHEVNLTLTLPVHQAEKVLAYVRSLTGTAQPEAQPAKAPVEECTLKPDHQPVGGLPQLEFVPRHLEKHNLRYLLDDRLKQVVKFIVEKEGTFYNADLAGLLEVDDPQTSIYLGHLTRKLRKTGLSAGGFRGANWYSKVRSSGRTLINVRADALATLRKAIEE